MFYKIILILLIIGNKKIYINYNKNKEQNLNQSNIIINNKEYDKDIINKIVINKKIKKENPKHKLIIDKLNQSFNIYDYNSIHNNIEENVTIIKDTKDILNKESLIIIAAHSGTGKLAYFNDLNKLNINDNIKLIYNNRIFIFKIIKIYEENKNGYININKSNNSELILTTCSLNNKNKQLVIKSILKES